MHFAHYYANDTARWISYVTVIILLYCNVMSGQRKGLSLLLVTRVTITRVIIIIIMAIGDA